MVFLGGFFMWFYFGFLYVFFWWIFYGQPWAQDPFLYTVLDLRQIFHTASSATLK
jgi:hypothetical protein